MSALQTRIQQLEKERNEMLKQNEENIEFANKEKEKVHKMYLEE